MNGYLINHISKISKTWFLLTLYLGMGVLFQNNSISQTQNNAAEPAAEITHTEESKIKETKHLGEPESLPDTQFESPEKQFSSITLRDGTIVSGQMLHDRNSNTIIMKFIQKDGTFVFDYIAGNLVLHIQTIQQGSHKIFTPSESLLPPIKGTLTLKEGQQIHGDWYSSSTPDQMIVVNEDTNQAMVIQETSVIRARLMSQKVSLKDTPIHKKINHKKPLPLTPDEKPVKSDRETGLQKKNENLSSINQPISLQKTDYRSIQIMPKLKNPVPIPSIHSHVAVKTNVGQHFRGSIEFVKPNWIGIRVNQYGKVKFASPELTIIKRENIISILEESN